MVYLQRELGFLGGQHLFSGWADLVSPVQVDQLSISSDAGPPVSFQCPTSPAESADRGWTERTSVHSGTVPQRWPGQVWKCHVGATCFLDFQLLTAIWTCAAITSQTSWVPHRQDYVHSNATFLADVEV